VDKVYLIRCSDNIIRVCDKETADKAVSGLQFAYSEERDVVTTDEPWLWRIWVEKHGRAVCVEYDLVEDGSTYNVVPAHSEEELREIIEVRIRAQYGNGIQVICTRRTG
jgi:hypothetical protein